MKNQSPVTYNIRKGTQQALNSHYNYHDTDIDYLVEIQNGRELGSVALQGKQNNFVGHLSKGEIEKTFKSDVFQRALMANEHTGISALKTLLPHDMQTAQLLANIMQGRQQRYGDTEQDYFLNDMVGNRDAWTGYAAFNDIMGMKNMADKYGVSFQNGKGSITPAAKTRGRGSDFASAVNNMKSAIGFIGEQERLVKEKNSTQSPV